MHLINFVEDGIVYEARVYDGKVNCEVCAEKRPSLFSVEPKNYNKNKIIFCGNCCYKIENEVKTESSNIYTPDFTNTPFELVKMESGGQEFYKENEEIKIV